MAENITCLQSVPAHYLSNSPIGHQGNLQKLTRKQGINRKGKKTKTRTVQTRQVTVLVGKAKLKRETIRKKRVIQKDIDMAGWSSGFQDYPPPNNYVPHNSYPATNQNLGRSHNSQVRETVAYEPSLRNMKGRHSSSLSQNYDSMGQNINMGGHSSQEYSGFEIGDSVPSSSLSKDMNWRVDRPGASERISQVNAPVIVVDYGHVRTNPPQNASEPWGSAVNRDRGQSNVHMRPPPMSHENISFINNIAITEDIMSSLKKTVHLVSGGSEVSSGAYQNTSLPSYNPSVAKRNAVPITALFAESLPDHRKHLDPYNNASDFPRLQQVRVTQKKTDRNKAFNYLKEWRQKINLPTDTLMLEREELFPSDRDRGSGLVDVSPTSLSGLQHQEGSSPSRAMTSQRRLTPLYVMGEKQRWNPSMKPVTSSLSSISDVEDFGLDERRNKDFSYSKESKRKDKFSRESDYSTNPGLRRNQSFDRVEANFKQKGYGPSLSYRSRSRSRSRTFAASPSRLRSRSPHRKSQWGKSADNSRRTLSPISSTHRTLQSRNSPFMSPGSHFSSGYEPHGQETSSLQNLFDRPPQLSGRMYSRSPSPRLRRLDLGKFSPDSGHARSPIRRNLRPRDLSPGSLITDSRSQSPISRRHLTYPTLSSQSRSPRDRGLTSRSISPKNRRLAARSRSPRSLSSRGRRLSSRSRSPRSRINVTRVRSPRGARITSRSPSPRSRRSLSPRNNRSPLWHQSPRNRRLSRGRSFSPRNKGRASPRHQSPRNGGLSRSRSPRYRKRSPRNRRYPSRSPSPDYRRLSLRSLSPGNRRILSRTPSPRDRSSRSPGLEKRDFDLSLASRLDSAESNQIVHRSLSGRQSPSGRNKGSSLHHDRIYFDKHSDKVSLYDDELGSSSPDRRHWSEEGGTSKRTVSVSEERNEKNLDELLKQIRNTQDEDKKLLRTGKDSPEDLRHSITGRKAVKVASTSENEEADEDLRLKLLRIKEKKISKRIEILEKESLKTESQLIEIEQNLENSQSSLEDDLPHDYKFSSRAKRSSSPTFVSKGHSERKVLREEDILDAELSSVELRRIKSGRLGKGQHGDQWDSRSRRESDSNRVDLDFVQGGRTKGNRSTSTSYRVGQEKKSRERDSGGRINERRYPRGSRKY
ncbi:uncharacterized protein LOC143020690 [Oratosquilla oratoria]|uniref:uncharacterized protein LOC143020690 n=1 Tax=Oratosquilla oratoria TaxID=337810 RepID=UPI003F76CC4C